jgi:hypothetical protein
VLRRAGNIDDTDDLAIGGIADRRRCARPSLNLLTEVLRPIDLNGLS